jgi:hypothetical protein
VLGARGLTNTPFGWTNGPSESDGMCSANTRSAEPATQEESLGHHDFVRHLIRHMANVMASSASLYIGERLMDTQTSSLGGVLSTTAVLLAVTVSGPLNAQQGLKEQIVGIWSAVSQYVEQDGKKLEPFGANPNVLPISTRS